MTNNVKIFDAAQYVVIMLDGVPRGKLDLLLFFAQSYSLVWDGDPLFSEPIEATASGPQCPSLTEVLGATSLVSETVIKPRDLFNYSDPKTLDEEQRLTLDEVLRRYGHDDWKELSIKVMKDKRWKEAVDLSTIVEREILDPKSIRAYYDF
jgi:uncharacterized phage-associated protein